MFSRLFAITYRHIRGHDVPLDLPMGVQLGFVLRKGADAVRGLMHRPRYRHAEGLSFRGKGAVTSEARYLSIGKNVVLGPGSRINAFSDNGVRLGNNVTIGPRANLMGSTVIREPGVGITVGDNSSIGQNNIIWGQGGVFIGTDCLLGPNVVIVSENHGTSAPGVPIRKQQNIREAVIIGDDCWLGAGVKVLAGVRIGQGAVVAAGAVVTKPVDPYTIVAGVPARPVGQRPHEHLAQSRRKADDAA